MKEEKTVVNLENQHQYFFVTFPLPFWTNEISNIEIKSKQMGGSNDFIYGND